MSCLICGRWQFSFAGLKTVESLTCNYRCHPHTLFKSTRVFGGKKQKSRTSSVHRIELVSPGLFVGRNLRPERQLPPSLPSSLPLSFLPPFLHLSVSPYFSPLPSLSLSFFSCLMNPLVSASRGVAPTVFFAHATTPRIDLAPPCCFWQPHGPPYLSILLHDFPENEKLFGREDQESLVLMVVDLDENLP